MNKLKLILGITCLVAAVGLTYANLTLPPESIWFDIGYGNMPWAPPIIFAIIGLVLLVGSLRQSGESLSEQASGPEAVADPAKVALNRRFETVGWGCFLVMLGGFMFIPDSVVEEGLWSIGIGLIFLGLNAARYFNGIHMSEVTTFLGILALVGGVAQLLGWTWLGGAFFFILLGAYLVLKPWFDKQKLFGKAEQG
jgi:hypothetical protein